MELDSLVFDIFFTFDGFGLAVLLEQVILQLSFRLDSLYYVLKIGQSFSYLALPNHNHMPACGLQCGVFLFVVCYIAVEFRLPELHVGLRRARRLAALVTMPEATVHENNRVPFWKHDVGMAGQLGGMKAVAEPQGVKMTAHKHLWFRVF